MEVVTSAERHDLDEQANEAFRPGWPEFIFHDPVSREYIGSYVVPDALDLVSIDCEQDLGVYEETNLWMRHK